MSEQQSRIEDRLYTYRQKENESRKGAHTLCLYDVTSSYLEGEKNELAAYGYNRDKKKGKKQIVIGLLTNIQGVPMSVSVFKGNTPDTETVPDQIKTIAQRFKAKQVVMVGDRGMIKTPQKTALNEVDFNYITAITKKQIDTLLKKGAIQLGLFDTEVVEVVDQDKRYLLRRNPLRKEEVEKNRESRRECLHKKVQEANHYLNKHPKANPLVQLKRLQEKLITLGCNRFCCLLIKARELVIEVDADALKNEAQLDGCYVLETDVLSTEMTTAEVHNTYKGLAKVETAFRTMKTSCLEIRPLYVRKESSRTYALF